MDTGNTVTRVEHIGIAVRSLADSIPLYEKLLGTRCYAVEEVADQEVKTALFRVGETKIELLESTDPEGPIARFILKRGEGIHHIALAVPDVKSALASLSVQGIKPIDTVPRPGAEGMSIAFLHPASTGSVLLELCAKS
jgi:methylmalonyl-CoA/ethylmalonyl-CoA epimerase